ncbi:methyl-accepting chemotaxis protein [Paraburkholderia sp. XV]|uniref:methyl-accepting chemotaxis protein n=1 Tax=Paraburkholderia sp. XV TaxID=2831520 RepID=UPI001CD7C8CB|nr:methyl-accepting chemotaxis protein [Paraburkholderia sp. XV]
MFSSIKGRLGLVMGFLGILLVEIGCTGLVGMHHADNTSYNLYAESLPSAIDVGDIATYIARERLAFDRAVLNAGSPEAEDAVHRATAMREKSDKAWRAFIAMPMSSAEKELAVSFDSERLSLQKVLDAGFAALHAGDNHNIRDITNDLQSAYAKLESRGEQLRQRQIDDAKAAYEQDQAEFSLFCILNIASIIVGMVAAAFSWWSLRQKITRPLESALSHFDAIASGDLRNEVMITSNDEMGQLLGGLAAMRQSLLKTVQSVLSGSETIVQATKEIASGNIDLSSRTEEQAAALQETAASMEQITSVVRQNAENARQASQLAQNASEVADKGSQVVEQVVTTMTGISDSSAKIADIISIIESIAFQTNILALNAAVEAARAGEEGRGFAVVAGEVRTLAQRSSTAAKEIKELIEASVERVRTGSELVNDAGTTMTAISRSVQRVTDIMGEIAAASHEQSAGIEQVGKAVTQMDEVTQQNAALVEEAAAAAKSLEYQASALRETVEIFKT